MAKPILKWRRCNGEWRAGPFRLAFFGTTGANVVACLDGLTHNVETEARAKSACARLARKIIAATKRGRHGK